MDSSQMRKQIEQSVIYKNIPVFDRESDEIGREDIDECVGVI